MADWVPIEKDKKHILKEKEKARNMRKSDWWKNKLAEGICYYCHRKFRPDELTMDHIVPLARGGKSTKGNIVACCKECNNKKKYYTPVELLFQELDQENIGEEHKENDSK